MLEIEVKVVRNEIPNFFAACFFSCSSLSRSTLVMLFSYQQQVKMSYSERMTAFRLFLLFCCNISDIQLISLCSFWSKASM